MNERFRLALDPERLRALGHRIVESLVRQDATVADQPVLQTATRGALERLLREPLPRQPSDPWAVIDRIERVVLEHTVREGHPRFFAFIPGVGNLVGAFADALASGYNVFSGSWLESSGPTMVELVTIDWLRQLAGLPESAGGLFVSGGSMANLTALVAARHARVPEELWARGVVYCSDQSHVSIDRALRVMGLPSSQLRRVPADDRWRLSPDAVARSIEADRLRGLVPFCIVANAGTTNTGAVDPLPELSDLCRREGLWLHADGAHGAAALFSERARGLLAGVELVDSLTLDPHKWLFQPFACACVIARDAETLRRAFSIAPEYVQDASVRDGEVNLWDYGVEMTRPFRALKLWTSLQVFGADAFAEAVDRGIVLAEHAERELRGRARWRIVSAAQLACLTFRYEVAGKTDADDLNRRIGLELMEEGTALVLSTVVKKETVLRLCTINPRTTEADVTATVDRLDAIAERLAAGVGKARTT